MNVFNVDNRSRVEWLRHFFMVGNCLCHPCSLVRRECYTEIGLLNPVYAKTPDLDLWIRLVLKYDIFILDRKLIHMRWLGNENNASGETRNNRSQVYFEHRHSLDHYLEITDPGEFLSIFPEATKYGKVTSGTIPYHLGRLAIENGWYYKVLWGLDVIYSLLVDQRLARQVETNCNFTYKDYMQLTGDHDPFGIYQFVFGDIDRIGNKDGFKQKLGKLVVRVLIWMKRTSPSWMKTGMKRTLLKLQAHRKVFGLITRLVPGFIKKYYYFILAA
jgi:hypothetical protein